MCVPAFTHKQNTPECTAIQPQTQTFKQIDTHIKKIIFIHYYCNASIPT